MKKVKLVPILLVICVLLAGLVAYSLLSGWLGGYNPDRYIDLGEYKNLTLQTAAAAPTDGEIEAALQTLLEQLASEEAVTDGAKTGDTVNIDYAGQIDGTDAAAFTAQDTSLTLGEDSFPVRGMDDALLHTKPGDTLTVTLPVQEDYFLSEYAGETVRFTVTVNTVTRKVVPELTDQLAQKLGDYETAEEFRTSFADQYRKERGAENAATIRSELWNLVVEGTVVRAYPQKELTALQEEFQAQVQAGADEYEMDFYDYASFMYGTDDEQAFQDYSLSYCQSILKHQMVLKAICKRENIQLSEEEYQQYVTRYLALYAEEQYTEEDLLEIFGGEEGLREQFLMEKATDVIEETATVETAE